LRKKLFSSPAWFILFLITLTVWGILITLYIFNEKNDTTGPAQPNTDELTENEHQPQSDQGPIADIILPEDFFFGTASSDFQTTIGTPNSDWHHFIEKIKAESPKDKIILPGIGTDFLNRYKEDFDAASEIGIQMHRISLEWARLQPEEDKWDLEAAKKYVEIFNYMRSKGVEPMICLNHFALPDWFVEKGSWTGISAARDYERFAKFVAKFIGKPASVKWWLTFNEPQIILGQGYLKGQWPPFKTIKSYNDAPGTKMFVETTGRLLDGHRLAYRAIHGEIPNAMVGFASAPGSFYPMDPESSLDQTAVNILNSLYGLMIDNMVGSDRDFIGINYYGRNKLKLHMSVGRQMISWLSDNQPFAVGWETPEQRKQGDRPREFYPKGLYDMIMEFKSAGVPIIITENGINDESDKFREEFLTIHIKAVTDAIRDGADVRGYMYWALTDTWEWDGFFSHFGLVAIDHQNNLARSIRPSALTYSEIIRTKTLSKELQEKHKELLPK
jgi:beta-glucosidase